MEGRYDNPIPNRFLAPYKLFLNSGSDSTESIPYNLSPLSVVMEQVLYVTP
jgi:hypothetical protein